MKWSDDVTKEAVRAIKEKHFSICLAVEAFTVHFSCLQRRLHCIRTNKCLTKRGIQTGLYCE